MSHTHILRHGAGFVTFFRFGNAWQDIAPPETEKSREPYRLPGKCLTYHSLTAPAEMLLMMYLEKKQNTSRMGITEIATARYVAP